MKPSTSTTGKVNSEAVVAIQKANKDFGFKFDLKNKEHNYYFFVEKKTNMPIWESVTYKLYKVNGTTWKVAMEPKIKNFKCKKAEERMDVLWFDIPTWVVVKS